MIIVVQLEHDSSLTLSDLRVPNIRAVWVWVYRWLENSLCLNLALAVNHILVGAKLVESHRAACV